MGTVADRLDLLGDAHLLISSQDVYDEFLDRCVDEGIIPVVLSGHLLQEMFVEFPEVEAVEHIFIKLICDIIEFAEVKEKSVEPGNIGSGYAYPGKVYLKTSENEVFIAIFKYRMHSLGRDDNKFALVDDIRGVVDGYRCFSLDDNEEFRIIMQMCFNREGL